MESRISDLIQLFKVDEEFLLKEKNKHNYNCSISKDISANCRNIEQKLKKLQNLKKDISGLSNPLGTLFRTIEIFISNYLSLLKDAYILKEAGMDKYYHSKANCEATQQMGVLGREIAKGLSDLKELYDQYTYTHTHRVTIEEAIKDSERDQIANKFGRTMGRKYPNCNCSEMMKEQLPKNKR